MLSKVYKLEAGKGWWGRGGVWEKTSRDIAVGT
jgi:hypothetical protein